MEITERQREIQNAVTQAFYNGEENSDFRTKLMKSPVKVIENLVGYKLSESEIVEVINQDFTNDLELNDSQLELVAGGDDIDDLKKSWDNLVTTIKAYFKN